MKQDLKPGDGGGGVKRKADWETNFKGARTMSYQSSRSSLYDQMDGGKMTEEEEKVRRLKSKRLVCNKKLEPQENTFLCFILLDLNDNTSNKFFVSKAKDMKQDLKPGDGRRNQKEGHCIRYGFKKADKEQ